MTSTNIKDHVKGKKNFKHTDHQLAFQHLFPKRQDGP